MKKALVSLAVGLAVIGYLGCSQNNPVAPSQAPAQGSMVFALDAADNIASGQVTVTKGALTHVLPITITDHAGSVTFSGIQVGHWSILVQLFDADGVEIYTGDGTAVVTKNSTTTVTVHVNHNTGTLVINVEVPGLVLWNKLGSEYEINHSETGPDMQIQNGSAGLTYVPGRFGNAVQFPDVYGGGPVLTGPSSLLNKERGCIEMWFKAPLDVVNGTIQNLPPESWAMFYCCKWDGSHDYKGASIYFGNLDGVSPYLSSIYQYGNDTAHEYEIIKDMVSSYAAGDWVHVAYTWDVQGTIEGYKTMALYVNGFQCASSQHSIEVREPWHQLLVLGGDFINGQCFRNGAIDNIKIWNYPKTDFSDRFVE